MAKKDRIIASINRIISESPSIILDIIKRENSLSPKFVIQIVDDNQSFPCDESQIILGIHSLSILWNICYDYFESHQLVSDYYTRDIIRNNDKIDICIETKELNEDIFDFTDNYEEEILRTVWPLVENALAYTLYHEFGHIKYDQANKMQIENEKRADLFAMNIVNNKCMGYQDVKLIENPVFLGAFLDNLLILHVSDPNEADVAMSHPHPIERIYLFMEFFHIEDNSFLWDYAYKNVVKWITKNNLAMTFEKDCSIKFKDKFMDAYHRYKK